MGATKLAAGAQTFAIRNEGSKVTEVYVYGSDDRVMAEAENIKADGSRDLTVLLRTGLYTVACKPGMTGDGIRQNITVVPASSSTAAAADPQVEAGFRAYTTYVQGQVADLTGKIKAFTDAVKAGDVAAAKRLYGASRVPWERIEPVAESFGDLDPKVGARANDVEAGTDWTGWHQIEKSLWTSNSTAGMAPYAD